MLFIDATHQGGGRRKNLIHEDEDSFFWGELYALADNIDKLSHCEISRDQIFFLVDGSDVRLLDLLADDL